MLKSRCKQHKLTTRQSFVQPPVVSNRLVDAVVTVVSTVHVVFAESRYGGKSARGPTRNV